MILLKSKYKNVLIVLGCQPEINGMPSKFMMGRLKKAVKLHKKNKYSKIILSGGVLKYPISEAKVMSMFIKEFIPESKLIIENKSKSTLQNAVFCWEKIKDHKVKRITIVTSALHIPRVKYIFGSVFQHMGCIIKFAGVTDRLSMSGYMRFKLRESAGFIKDKIYLSIFRWRGR